MSRCHDVRLVFTRAWLPRASQLDKGGIGFGNLLSGDGADANAKISKVWKKSGCFFQALERGGSSFSKAWKSAAAQPTEHGHHQGIQRIDERG